MTTNGQYLVIGEFDDPVSADRAIVALQQAGFRNDQIRYTTEENRPKGIKALFSGEKTTSREKLTNDLIHMGVDPEDARIFQREYESGHPLVAVEGRGDIQEALNILASQGAHGPEELASRQAPPGAPGRSADTAEKRPPEVPPAEPAEPQKMRLHAERLKAYKQPGQTGEVNIRKEVVTEQQTLNVPVTREEVVIERRSLAEDAAAAEEPIGEGEEIRIPIREEQVQVTKEAVATGEVEISKREVKENRQFTETVRHEEPAIEKQGEAQVIDTSMNQPPDQPQV